MAHLSLLSLMLLLGQDALFASASSFHMAPEAFSLDTWPAAGQIHARHSHRRHHRRRALSKCPSQDVQVTANQTSASASAASSASSSQSVPSSRSSSNSASKKSKTSRWNWTDYSKTAYGVNIGSWLMLERWMVTDLFEQNAPDAIDDYTFSKTLGNKTAAVLKPHWDSYVTDADIDDIAQSGGNMVRIPVGYWAFHENVYDDPFPALQGQQAQITRALKRMAKNNIYAIIDLHSVPGRSSGDQCNGQTNSPTNFYDPDMQQYNDAVIRNVYKFIANCPYRNSIAGIGLVNEPDACNTEYNQTRVDALEGYYQRSYDYLTAQSFKVPAIIHHGYCGIDHWSDFVADKDPQYLIMEDHPCKQPLNLLRLLDKLTDSGTFVSTSSEEDALGGVCYKAQEYTKYPIPVVVTESTMDMKVGGSSFSPTMFAQQVSAFAATGGTLFWSHKGHNEYADGWNWLKMVAEGVAQKPSNTTDLASWARGLGNTCGSLSKPSWAT